MKAHDEGPRPGDATGAGNAEGKCCLNTIIRYYYFWLARGSSECNSSACCGAPGLSFKVVLLRIIEALATKWYILGLMAQK